MNRPAMAKRRNYNNHTDSPRVKRKVDFDSQLEHVLVNAGQVESPIASNKATSNYSPGASSLSSAIVTPSKTKKEAQENTYGKRTNSGEVVVSYNPKNLDPISISSVATVTNCYGLVDEYKYMTDRDRSSALNAHLNSFQTKIIKQEAKNSEKGDGNQEEFSNFEFVGVPHASSQFNVGRICNEAHEGKMNETTILLEGSKNGSNGARISLDVNKIDKKSFSLFPGQIVGVRGVNSTGRKMIVEEIVEGIQTELVKSRRDELKKMCKLGEEDGHKIFAVAGPYTSNQDLKYEPLMDLLNLVVQEKPAVVILMGPFVDLRQPMLQHGDEVVLEYEQDESEGGGTVRRYVSYETLFAAKISKELEDLYNEFPYLRTKFVIVPSLEDAVSEPV